MAFAREKKENEKFILVIERQEHWRELSVHALEDAGFDVDATDNYDCIAPLIRKHGANPELVVLGCARVRPEEFRLILRLIKRGIHILVLCASLSSEEIRRLFLAKADNVAIKPYERDAIVKLVEQTLHLIASRSSYQAALREGV